MRRPSDGAGVTRRAAVCAFKRELARGFRREPTASERRAWDLLRNRRCLGLKFRRQQVVRGFVVDFYCAELRLALEIDGSVHLEPDQVEWDRQRTVLLQRSGIREIRLPAEDVSKEKLEAALRPLLPLSLQGEGAGG